MKRKTQLSLTMSIVVFLLAAQTQAHRRIPEAAVMMRARMIRETWLYQMSLEW